jgi:pimeloyl-ACP methyl ester carboxylesterase
LEDINHIAKWERFVALEKSSAMLESQNCKLELLLENSAGEEIACTTACTVEMYGQNGKFPNLPFRFRLNNPCNRDMYFAVFHLPSDYTVDILTQTGIISSGEIKQVYNGNFELDDHSAELFYVKVVMSTENIDSQTLAQEALKGLGEIYVLENEKGDEFRSSRGGGIAKNQSDWFTQTLSIRLVGVDQQLSADKPLQLPGTAIKILPNPFLQAKVNTTSTSRENARGGDVLGILPRLLDAEVTSFIGAGDGSRGSANPLVINLEDIQGAENIRENPLQLEVQQALAPHERLLPITYDGEKIVLLGYSDTQPDGSILVTVNQLPDKQPPAGTRSLGKAVWLYLVKVAGIDKPELRHAFREGSKIKRSTTGLITKVAGAQRILLVVHGIIGDTRDMARFGLEAADTGRFDLVLTFDYENLNTPIDQTAAILRDELDKAGLAPGHGKELTLLAHSMGGLVSRWYIENLGGNKVVNQLVMAGTPNLGSNFGKVTEYIAWGSNLLGLAGALKLSIPYAAPILGFLGGLQTLTKTLAQMNYDDGSGFLKSLEKNPDPGIPYSIVAGSLDGYLAAEQDPALSDKVLDAIANVFNGKTDNDIAVEVDSITGVSPARQPAPQCKVVPCHHMNYFVHPESVAALQRYLGVEAVKI